MHSNRSDSFSAETGAHGASEIIQRRDVRAAINSVDKLIAKLTEACDEASPPTPQNILIERIDEASMSSSARTPNHNVYKCYRRSENSAFDAYESITEMPLKNFPKASACETEPVFASSACGRERIRISYARGDRLLHSERTSTKRQLATMANADGAMSSAMRDMLSRHERLREDMANLHLKMKALNLSRLTFMKKKA